MFGRGITLFTLFGFRVRVDASWLVIAALVTWTLAGGFFPSHLRGLPVEIYWTMGAVGAVGLFLSIVFHEMCHSLVARQYDLPMRGITLFIFGGVAEMEREPANAKTEFLMAAAGPVSSYVLAGVFYGLAVAGRDTSWPVAVTGVLLYLAMINALLATFNLIPAFPLDGGRIFRSAMWAWKGDMRWATRVASRIGSGFGVLLIVLGIFNVFRGDFIGGMWWFLIGMFLQNAARASYQQLVVRGALEGQKVSRFMKPDPVSVPPWISVQEFVDEYVYRYHFKMFPVVRDGALVGCIQTSQIRDVPRDEWNQHTVQELMRSCSPATAIAPDTDAIRAISLMNQTGNTRLLVVDSGRLVGIISLRDLLEFLSVKMDLEQGSHTRAA